MKSSILLKYENKWVALNTERNKVLFSSNSVEKLYKLLSKKANKNVILHYVMPFKGTLAPIKYG